MSTIKEIHCSPNHVLCTVSHIIYFHVTVFSFADKLRPVLKDRKTSM